MSQELTTDVLDTRPSWNMYEVEMLRLCAVKMEEFHLLGYAEVTADEIWECIRSRFKGQPRLHEVVAMIIGLHADKFMNYMTMNAYKGKLGEDVFSRNSFGGTEKPFDASFLR